MNKGFTLMEVVIAMGILSGIVLTITLLGVDVFDFGILIGDNLISQQELQLTIRKMVSEIRSMTQAVNGSYPLESASENSLVFYSDIDGDGLTERVRYFLDGNILKRGVIKPTGNPLTYPIGDEKLTEEAHDIYTPAGNIFNYYSSNYSGTQNPLTFPLDIPAIRLIKISITADANPMDVSSRINFSTSVNIRNL